MSANMHGNFDVVVELASNTIASAASSIISSSIPAEQEVSIDGITAKLIPQVSVNYVVFFDSPRIELFVDVTGSKLFVSKIEAGVSPVEIPAEQSEIPIDGEITIQDSLEINGDALFINFSSQSDEPSISINLNTTKIFSSALVQIYLAMKVINGENPDDVRKEIETTISSNIQTFIKDALNSLGEKVVLFPAMPPLSLLDFKATSFSLSALYRVGDKDSKADKSLIKRSVLSGLSPITNPDKVGICISHESLLKDFIRPSLKSLFSLNESGFDPVHPLRWTGDINLENLIDKVDSIKLKFLTSFIDEAGKIRILGTIKGSGVGFKVNAQFDVPITIEAKKSNSTIGFKPRLSEKPSVDIDIIIEAWVYLLAIVGGPALLLIIGITDAFAGSLLHGPIVKSIEQEIENALESIPTPSLEINEPNLQGILTGFPRVSLNQKDSELQFYSFLPGQQLPSGSRKHSLVLTFS